MRAVAHDVYAETNPAYGACVLAAFADAYASEAPRAPDITIAYLALPIALSHDLGRTFEGTNKNTGLMEWLQRRPEVQVGLADLVDGTLPVVTASIRLGVFSGVLVLGSNGSLGVGTKTIKASAIKALGDRPGQAFKRAERLGYWFAGAGSTRSVFDMMGLTV